MGRVNGDGGDTPDGGAEVGAVVAVARVEQLLVGVEVQDSVGRARELALANRRLEEETQRMNVCNF